MNRQFFCALMAAVTAFHFVTSAGATAAAPSYTLQIAPFFQGTDFGLVTGFNNSAQAVYERISFGSRAYWWDGTQERELPPGATQSQSVVLDLSDNGIAVGERLVNGSQRLAMIWQQGVPQDLGTLGGEQSEANAINDQGLIAGWSNRPDGSKHLFTWNGTFTDLGLLPADPTCCAAIEAVNNAGQIIGHSPGSLLKGWLYSNGQFILLPDLNGGNDSTPRDMNNAGLVVGASYPHQTNKRPATWTNGQIQALAMPPSAISGEARAINEAGEIVGSNMFGDANTGFSIQATLWKDGNPYLLKDLVTNLGDWQLRQSEQINDRGQILVYAISDTYAYQRVILTPVPEHSTFSLAIIALSITILRRRKSA